jgi:hypothetical protein
VVQTPVGFVQRQRLSGARLQHALADEAGTLRRAWCRVLLVEQFLRETAKVVDGARLGHGGKLPASCEPVGGNAQNQPWRLHPRQQLAAQRLPALAPAVVFDSIHRAAVSHEQHRHSLGAGQIKVGKSGGRCI